MKREKKQLGPTEWLSDWARSVDTPPIGVGAEWLARFAAAGVTQLYPMGDLFGLSYDLSWKYATGVAAVGPGFGFVEWLEDEPAAVASATRRLCEYVETFDRLRRFRLAAIDMRLVEATAQSLRNREGPARMFERMLETAIVVTYARPYLPSNRAGVGRRWRPERAPDIELHDRLIDDLRHPFHAHSDHTPLRTLTDTAAMLGLDGPPNYSEAWARLNDDDLEDIAALAARQAARFEEAASERSAAIGEVPSAALDIGDDLDGTELDFRADLDDRETLDGD